MENNNNISIMNFLTPKSVTTYMFNNYTVRQALEINDQHKFQVLPIIDRNGYYVSTVSEGDLLRHIKHMGDFNIYETANDRLDDVEKYRPYKAASVDTDYKVVLQLLLEQNFVPVVDSRNIYIGIIKRRTMIEYFLKERG